MGRGVRLFDGEDLSCLLTFPGAVELRVATTATGST